MRRQIQTAKGDVEVVKGGEESSKSKFGEWSRERGIWEVKSERAKGVGERVVDLEE